MSEIPVHPHPRRLADWLNPTEAKKVHSLIDKIYQRKNLEMAWERVRGNRGSGGIDGQSIREFVEQVEGKRPAHPPLGAHDHAGFLSGNSSSIRLLGQVGSFCRVSVSQAIGSIPFRRAVSSSD